MSASLPTVRPRSTPHTPPRSAPAPPTTDRPAARATTIPATTLPTSSTPTATAWNSSTRAGSTDHDSVMIYGATGYTGRMAAEHATAAGLDPILGGRNSHSTGTSGGTNWASNTGLSASTTPPASTKRVSDVTVVLNCAGPFMRTADPLMGCNPAGRPLSRCRCRTRQLPAGRDSRPTARSRRCDAPSRQRGQRRHARLSGRSCGATCLAPPARPDRAARDRVDVPRIGDQRCRELDHRVPARFDGHLVSRDPEDRGSSTSGPDPWPAPP